MGKSKKAFREYTKEQELAHENKELKNENIRLRKLLANFSASKDKRVTEITDQKASKNQTDQLKEAWRCNGTPGCDGHLEIVIFNKIDQEYYFRKCNSCFHRTRGQKYNKDTVKGIVKKTE